MLEERRNGVGRETELQWKGVGQCDESAYAICNMQYLPRIGGRATAVVDVRENVDSPHKMSKMYTECK
eukprot:scaffold293230_cov113-Cyclotella_meneghiniana.AAC.1